MVGQQRSIAWIEQAVIYGVIPRNFSSSGFGGIVERLDHLRDLGISALWLSPVNRSPAGDFGYAVVDYFELQPQYGSKEDFHDLVRQAHQRGIRVLMDVVPNHTSSQYPYFQDAEQRGRESPYYDYYDRDQQGQATHYFNWEHLPNLNYDNPAVQQWMIKALSYWVREFDIDGYRVDVAWGIKQRRPDFWPRCCAELRRIKPDLLLLAEASARDGYYCRNGFDAAYDWTDELGHWAWEHVFDDPATLTQRLHAALTNEGRGFDPATSIFRFLNNNDTGARFLTRYGLDMMRVATALLLTLPGLPCIYTGDEVGAEFSPYQDAGPIDWRERDDLYDYHRRLIALRRALPALHATGWLPLEIEPAAQVYAYLRYDGAQSAALVLLNFSGQAVEAALALPEAAWPLLANRPLVDRLNDDRLRLDGSGSLRIALPPWGARVLAAPDGGASSPGFEGGAAVGL